MTMAQRSPSSANFGAAASRRQARRPTTAIAPAPGEPDRRKYTVRIDAEPAERFERAVLAMIPELGRRVDKSEVMRELAELFACDPAVAKKVADALRRH
jgi:hypothetical protein